MIFEELELAIITRLKADTGTGGLYAGSTWASFIAGGIYSNWGLPSQFTTPYGVLEISLQADHTFPSDSFKALCSIAVFDNTRTGVNSVAKVLKRLHGDAVLQTGRVPSYGLHRHPLVLATNGYSATGGHCICTSHSIGIKEGDEHTVVGVFSFELTAQAVAANP